MTYTAFAESELASYYVITFNMMQHHKYSLSDIEGMLPWEFELYTTLLHNYVKEYNEKVAQASGTRREYA